MASRPRRRSLESAALALPIDDLPGIRPGTAKSLRAAGYQTVRSVARARDADLLALRGLGPAKLGRLRDAVRRLRADVAEIPDSMALPSTATIQDLLATRRPLVAIVGIELTALSSRERLVLRRRYFTAREPETLDTLARELGVSRERVRQLASTGISSMPHSRRAAVVADARIGALRGGRREPLTLVDLEREDPWFAGCSREPRLLGGMLDALDARHRVTQYDPGIDILVPRAFPRPHRWVSWWTSRGGTRTAGDLDLARVAAAVEAEGAPELARLVAAHIASNARGGTHVELVKAAMLEVPGPQTVASVHAKLVARGHALTVRAVAGTLHDLRAVEVARATYVLREHMSVWDWLAEHAREAVTGILKRSPRVQWSCVDLVAELRHTDPQWPGLATPHVLDYLLRDAPGLVRRRRGGYARSRGRGRRAVTVADVAQEVLAAAGAPISTSELRRRVQEVRSICFFVTAKWPVVPLDAELWGLADRDLGLTVDRIDAMDERVRELLDASGTARADELAACCAQVWPEAKPVPPALIARWMRRRVGAYLDAERTGLCREQVCRVRSARARRGSPDAQAADRPSKG